MMMSPRKAFNFFGLAFFCYGFVCLKTLSKSLSLAKADETLNPSTFFKLCLKKGYEI